VLSSLSVGPGPSNPSPLVGWGDIIPGQFTGKEVFGGMINFQFMKFFLKPNC